MGLPFLVLAASAALATAPQDADVPRASDAETPTDEARSAPRRVPAYDFHNGFWLNLHHYLYSQALERKASHEPASDDSAWSAAVTYYVERLLDRDLLFDDGMLAIDWTLGQSEVSEHLDDAELDGELTFVLESTASIYRERFWSEHEAANAEWIAAIEPLVAAHVPSIAPRLSDLFANPWPTAPIRVDVLFYANWAGAYASIGPNHVRIGSRLPDRLSTPAAFEILVHESSHLILGTVFEAIASEASKRGMRTPRDLWHVLLFFTVGEIVRESAATPTDYVPFATKGGLYGRGPWAAFKEVIDHEWPSYMRGEITLDESIARMLARLPAPTGAGR